MPGAADNSVPAVPAVEPIKAPDGGKHALVVRVVQAWGLADDEKSRPYVRVRLLDPEGKEKQVQETKPINDGGSNPQWNEYLKFEGIEDPAMCAVCLELRDKTDTKDEPADGVAKVKLGLLGAASGFQQFRDTISSGWFSNVDLRFGINNFGTWGNSVRAENKLSLTIMGATEMVDMDGGMGGLFADKNDPYAYIELVDEDDFAIGKPRQTKVLWEGGNNVEFNETFEFVDLLCPSAYKLKLSVWDKDTMKKDDALGKTEFALGRCFRVAEPVGYEEILDVGKAHLKFSVCTGGAWGALSKEKVQAVPAAELAAPAVPPGHYMKCTVLSCTGLAAGSKGNDGKADPVCRLILRDEWGKTIQTVTTKGKDEKKKGKPKSKAKAKAKSKAKAKAKAKAEQAEPAEQGPKPDVEWHEEFLFRDIPNPCMCTLSVNVLDSGGEKGNRLGETELKLGVLAAKPGPQEDELDVAGHFWKTKVKLQLDNYGSWGNGQRSENKLYMMIKSAVGLPVRVGTIFRSKTDPYVEVELKGPDGIVLQTKATTPKHDAGSDPKWDEELVFENIESPAACTLHIVCYDKSLGKDKKLGHTELPCGVLGCSSEYTAFDGTTLGGTAKLNFSMHTGGTWGNKEPGKDPAPKGCCSVM